MSDDLDRACELLRLRRWRDAAAAALRHLATEPDSVDGHVMLAGARIELGDAAGSIESAREAVRLDPEDAHSHFVLAMALGQGGQLRTAMASVHRALQLDPEKAPAHDYAARLLFDRGRYKTALASAERAINLAPEDADCLATHARILRALGRRTKAADSLAQGMRADPEHGELASLQGAAHLEGGNAEAAIESFVSALRKRPTDEAARQGLLEALRGRSRFYRVVLRVRVGVASLFRGNFTAMWIVLVAAGAVARAFGGNEARATLFAGLVGLLVTPTDVANAFLLAHPLGRHLLKRHERVCAVLANLLLMAAAVLATLSWLRPAPGLRIWAIVCLGVAVATSVGRVIIRHTNWKHPATIRIGTLLVIMVVLLVILLATR